MDIQARIPCGVGAVHNFIHKHDPLEAEEILEAMQLDPNPGNLPAEHNFGRLSRGAPNAAEKARAKEKRDQIAQAMWDSYQEILAQRGGDETLEEPVL